MPVDFFQGQRQVHDWGARTTTFFSSSVSKRTLGSCVVLGLFVALGHLVEEAAGYTVQIDLAKIGLLGAVLSALLVFRTNASYDRWWEGRKLWGQLVNDSRNLALKIQAMVDDITPEESRLVTGLITGFPYCLRDHLRDGPTKDTLSHLPEEIPAAVSHLPSHISGRLFQVVRGWRDNNRVHRLDHHLIDQHISALMDICGACERIRTTPLPLSHRALIPLLLAVFLVVAPLVIELTVSSVLAGFVVAYFLIGLELVAEDIEEPFGYDADDLPLDRICGNIERSVREILRDLQPLPEVELDET